MDVVTVDYGKTFDRVCDEGKKGCKQKKTFSHLKHPHLESQVHYYFQGLQHKKKKKSLNVLSLQS